VRVVIVGCGRIGAFVARRLVAAGHHVCVVDQEAGSLARLGRNFPGRTVVGTGFDEEVLRQAEVAQADAVVVLTNVDATNFMVAQAVVELFAVRRVTVRVNDPEFSSLYGELGLQTIDVPDLVLERVATALQIEPGGAQP
jgi:trk system potassium uptake protein TrkA